MPYEHVLIGTTTFVSKFPSLIYIVISAITSLSSDFLYQTMKPMKKSPKKRKKTKMKRTKRRKRVKLKRRR